MKKLSLFTPIVITTIFVLTLPSWAKDCPTIPKKIKEVTVKDDSATLRTESKTTSKKGSRTLRGNKLKVVDINATEDSEGNDYCWYKVSPINNNLDNKEYWIAGIGLKEFSSWSISPPPTHGGISTPSSEKGFSISWIVWVLAPIGIIGIVVVGLFAYDRIRRSGYFNNLSRNYAKTDNLSSSNPYTTIIKTDEDIPSLEESVRLIESITQEYLPQIVELAKENVKQDLVKEVRKIKSTVTKQDRQISEFKAEISKQLKAEKGSSVEATNKENIDNRTEKKEALTEKSFENKDSQISKIGLESKNQDDKKEWEKLVDKFNERNKEHFARLNPQFLKLTDKSIHGRPNLIGTPVVQLVHSTESEASYLKIEADQENWLFPNIISSQVNKIMHILSPSIFTLDYSLNNPQLIKLIKPAKLKEVSSGLWEIEELGIFTQRNNIITEIDLPLSHNLPSQDINSLPAFSPETINPKEIDLGILYYLRKNENASFIDLLSNLQCDKQHLRDRLLILQEEEFIEIVNKADENNTIYKML
jgi:hypothetical protein